MTKELEDIKHFELHKELLPFVGEEYDKHKILLIGESHYLPEKYSKNESVIDNWYQSDNEIPEEDKNWFNTRYVVTSYIDGIYKSRAHSIFRNPADVFVKYIEKDEDIKIDGKKKREAFKYFAFYNYFQRPELSNGKSINCTPIDCEYAKNISNEIFEILKPNLIVFLSKKAYNNYYISMNGKTKENIVSVAHPTCKWWYCESSKNKSGKEMFNTYLNVFLN